MQEKTQDLLKEFLQILEELLTLGGAFSIHTVLQLSEKLLLFPAELGRCLHYHREPMVTPAAHIVHLRDALAAETEHLSGLGSLGNSEFLLAVQGGNFNFRTQSRLCILRKTYFC